MQLEVLDVGSFHPVENLEHNVHVVAFEHFAHIAGHFAQTGVPGVVTLSHHSSGKHSLYDNVGHDVEAVVLT